jgi:hypothetical protein
MEENNKLIEFENQQIRRIGTTVHGGILSFMLSKY